jgi:hypothetical protein
MQPIPALSCFHDDALVARRALAAELDPLRIQFEDVSIGIFHVCVPFADALELVLLAPEQPAPGPNDLCDSAVNILVVLEVKAPMTHSAAADRHTLYLRQRDDIFASGVLKIIWRPRGCNPIGPG